MPTWIALLKGINVGGKNLLPMGTLKADFETLKFRNVKTYIQSGNIVFDSDFRSSSTLQRLIEVLIETRHMIALDAMIISPAQLAKAIENNPFADAEADPASLHLFFPLKSKFNANLSSLISIKAQTESFEIVENIFYLHAPEGIGRSKLVVNIKKGLGVETTARNFRTVEKLHQIISEF